MEDGLKLSIFLTQVHLLLFCASNISRRDSELQLENTKGCNPADECDKFQILLNWEEKSRCTKLSLGLQSEVHIKNDISVVKGEAGSYGFHLVWPEMYIFNTTSIYVSSTEWLKIPCSFIYPFADPVKAIRRTTFEGRKQSSGKWINLDVRIFPAAVNAQNRLSLSWSGWAVIAGIWGATPFYLSAEQIYWNPGEAINFKSCKFSSTE